MATKSYFVGPQDGWVKVVSAGASYSTRIGAFPHTHPIYVYGDPTTTPTDATVNGVLVCHKPFKTENSVTGGNKDAFWVRVKTPSNASSNTHPGQTRIDVYSDGGTLP